MVLTFLVIQWRQISLSVLLGRFNKTQGLDGQLAFIIGWKCRKSFFFWNLIRTSRVEVLVRTFCSCFVHEDTVEHKRGDFPSLYFSFRITGLLFFFLRFLPWVTFPSLYFRHVLKLILRLRKHTHTHTSMQPLLLLLQCYRHSLCSLFCFLKLNLIAESLLINTGSNLPHEPTITNNLGLKGFYLSLEL